MNITLIHVYIPDLYVNVLFHRAPHILVYILWDVSFLAIVLTTLFGTPTKSLAHQEVLHRTYSIAHDK